MKKTPENFRIKLGEFGSDESHGKNGFFIVPHGEINFIVIISDGFGWDHVSVSIDRNQCFEKRCPTWEEMCFIKDLFFEDEETVVQFHPKKSAYVNNYAYCLHLWRCQSNETILPPGFLTGFKELGVLE